MASIYNYAQKLPTDPITGCLEVGDYECKETFYLKQQNEILASQKENAQLRTEMSSLQSEFSQLKAEYQTKQAQQKDFLTATILNTSAIPSLVIGLILGAIVMFLALKKFSPKI